METCPCCSSKLYTDCCEPYVLGKRIPKTPEELMRSRYTAYTKANVDYIAETMRGPAALEFDKEQSQVLAQHIIWHNLKVIRTQLEHSVGFVEFIAHYSLNNKKDIIYEISEFHFENGRWYYMDGVTPKIGRNDLCPCGTQKKHKKCCGVNI